MAVVEDEAELELAPEWTTRARDWESQGSTNSMVAGAWAGIVGVRRRHEATSSLGGGQIRCSFWKNTVL